MNNLFQRTSSHWVRYDEYEYRQAEDGALYITPAPKAKPDVYDPVKDAEPMVLDMLNVGMLCMKRGMEEEKQEAVLDFVSKYGLLGFMTALPTTPEFIKYEAVYLPTNHFIREESLATDKYLEYFFPFDKLDFSKAGKESAWNISGDRKMMMLAAAFGNEP